MNWNQYKRKGLSEMRPYTIGEDVAHVSISEPDRANGSPKIGDMIARNPKNHADQWLVAKAYFDDNLEPAQGDSKQGKATEIADYLFVNGNGQQAERLELLLPSGRYGGGWSKPAVTDAVVRILG